MLTCLLTYPLTHSILPCFLLNTPLLPARGPCGRAGVWPHSTWCDACGCRPARISLRLCIPLSLSPGAASSSRSCARSRTWTSSCVSTARGGSSDLVTRRLWFEESERSIAHTCTPMSNVVCLLCALQFQWSMVAVIYTPPTHIGHAPIDYWCEPSFGL